MNIFKKCSAFIIAFGVLYIINLTSIAVYADWETKDSKIYYIDDSGQKATGWQTINDKIYYFSSDGVMKTGWLTMKSGKKYYLKSDGSMATGWIKIGNNKYYFNKKGIMVTGDTKIGKKIYQFDSNGVLLRQYKDTIVQIGDKYYFIDENGLLYEDTFIEYLDTMYYIGKNGYTISTTEAIEDYYYVFDAQKGLIDFYVSVKTTISKDASATSKGMPSNFSGVIDTDFKTECRVGKSNYKVDCISSLKNRTNAEVGVTIYASFYDENGNVVENRQIAYIRKIGKNESSKVTKTLYLDYIPSEVIITDIEANFK